MSAFTFVFFFQLDSGKIELYVYIYICFASVIYNTSEPNKFPQNAAIRISI